ncbi:WD40 domain-containing protein, partial [Oryctes borbonicus]
NFVSKPIIYQERMRPGQAKMICASFSPGGCFLATGSADHHVRVYHMAGDEGPRRILEMEAHTDRVDSIQWAHSGLKFVSGSKDGMAHIWHFESQQWKSKKLNMTTKLPNADSAEVEDLRKLKVTMVAWDVSDTWIITAVSDYKLKVWTAVDGDLYKVLSGHTDEIYVLESHPKDPHIVLSAGHDGQLYVWNILQGKSVVHFTNNIEGQGYGAVFDAKWSPCGNMIAASDSHGHILIFGFGSGNPQMKLLPKELFFHTDYRPLVRDANHMVLDEQTQVAPHLMPPPFLVDIDGNPYPPMLQRLVPGRENCESEQLIPNIVVGNEGTASFFSKTGTQEVIEGLPDDHPRYESFPESNWQGNYIRPGVRTGMRTSSDVEGIRHSSGNWQRDPNKEWGKRLLMKPIEKCQLDRTKRMVEALATKETAHYNREMRHRPIMINTNSAVVTENGKGKRKRKHYHTRSAEMEGSEVEQDDGDANSSGSEYSTSKDTEFSDSSSSASESSGYSDWVADEGVTLEPPKRSKRKQIPRQTSPVNNAEPKPKWEPHDIAPNIDKIKEVPENYKPSDWLGETMPKKVPYFPQMGDEVVYFRQGHQLYVNAVQTKKVYEMNAKDFPWMKNQLKDCEFVKIVGIKYEIRPPRLCCLKLALLDRDGRLTGNVFTVKYHDMPDVIDFFVLKQTYEVAISRLWNSGDRFRCMIDDSWWIGEVVSKSPVSEEFPDSLFMCYEIRWDNGEYERMSPWDMEPLKEDRMPANPCEPVPVLPEEIQSMLYQPQMEEWPHGDREGSTRRILRGLDNVMGLAIAEPFLVPVDLNEYPSYAMVVEYPIDLSTIKARFENNFYRRITSSQFDVRYLATNAEKFNKPHSIIVKRARIITELCLRIIKASTEVLDVTAIYHQLMDNYESSDTEADVDIFQPGPSSTTRSLRPLTTRNFCNPDDWKVEARKLLDALWRCEDSAPFRAPVDHIKHPDYYQIIDTPMDLSSIKEDLCGGNYKTPTDFYKDMKLIFQNSKNYNTNKRSRIYAMTVRLSAMFEEHMGRLIYNWKTARKRARTR